MKNPIKNLKAYRKEQRSKREIFNYICSNHLLLKSQINSIERCSEQLRIFKHNTLINSTYDENSIIRENIKKDITALSLQIEKLQEKPNSIKCIEKQYAIIQEKNKRLEVIENQLLETRTLVDRLVMNHHPK